MVGDGDRECARGIGRAVRSVRHGAQRVGDVGGPVQQGRVAHLPGARGEGLLGHHGRIGGGRGGGAGLRGGARQRGRNLVPQADEHVRALVFDIRHAGREVHAACGQRRAGRIDADAVGAHAHGARRGAQHVVAAHEPRDEFAGRAVVDVVRRAGLLDAAVVHHHHGVGQGHGLLLRVRDVDEGQAQFLLPAPQLRAHLHAQEGVERGQGLVEQQHARLGDERARQRHALLLPAGEFARLALGQVAHGDALQQVLRAPVALRPADALHLEAEGHVVQRREVREQGEALEHHGRAARGGGQVGDVAVVQQHVAAGDRFVPGDHAQRGALAAARGAQQAAVAAARDAQVDAIDRGLAGGIALGQRDDLDGGGCRSKGGGVHALAVRKPHASAAYGLRTVLYTNHAANPHATHQGGGARTGNGRGMGRERRQAGAPRRFAGRHAASDREPGGQGRAAIIAPNSTAGAAYRSCRSDWSLR